MHASAASVIPATLDAPSFNHPATTMTYRLPALELDSWEDSKTTLHLFCQIVGKIRLKLAPRKNHWWFITLYVSSRGLTTRPIPYMNGYETFELSFDFVNHIFRIETSTGEQRSVALGDGFSVAAFHDWLHQELTALDIECEILAVPFDVNETRPFAECVDVVAWDKQAITDYWRATQWVDGVLKEFSGRSYSKTSPVHLYWHHMDIVVTRFSGEEGPDLDPEWRTSDKDAYSHEVISSGFWAGDDTVREAAFYTYAYPSPDGLEQDAIEPDAASWVMNNGSPMAYLSWEAVRMAEDPRAALLGFLESTYQAAAKRAGWDVEKLRVPALDRL